MGIEKKIEKSSRKLEMVEIIDESYTNRFIKIKEIARGLRGVIRSVQCKTSEKLYCSKSVRRNQKGKSIQNEIETEIKALDRLREIETVVNLNYVYRTRTEYTLILDLHKQDLHHIIERNEVLKESDVQKMFKTILETVNQMHQLGVIHLDLKPQNILLSDSEKIRICDFGLSKIQTNDDDSLNDSSNKENQYQLGGTIEYSAPEQIQYEPVSDKTDIWSLGVIAFVLLSGQSPFKCNADHETQNAIIECDYEFDNSFGWSSRSEKSKNLIRRCLHRLPNNRPSASELLLTDDWLADDWMMNDSELENREKIEKSNGSKMVELGRKLSKRQSTTSILDEENSNLESHDDNPNKKGRFSLADTKQLTMTEETAL